MLKSSFNTIEVKYLITLIKFKSSFNIIEVNYLITLIIVIVKIIIIPILYFQSLTEPGVFHSPSWISTACSFSLCTLLGICWFWLFRKLKNFSALDFSSTLSSRTHISATPISFRSTTHNSSLLLPTSSYVPCM